MDSSQWPVDINLAQELIQTMVDFLENGVVSTMVNQEVLNYFTMCQQLEVYHEKYKQKGFSMSFDSETGVFSISSDNSNMKYDLSCLADKLFEKFCHLSIPADTFKCALDCFIQLYGIDRFAKCVQKLASFKQIYNLETVINRTTGINFNMEAAILMEGYESLASSPHGMKRVLCLIEELIIDDECAETVVAMFACEEGLEPRIGREVKKILLHKLQGKFSHEPESKVWVKMMNSLAITDATNSYEPFLHFLLNLIKHFSSSLTIEDTANCSRARVCGVFTFSALILLISKLYRNKQSNQVIINFIFNQCALNSQLWTRVLESCHNLPPIEANPQSYYDLSTPDFKRWPLGWKQ